MTTNRKIRLRNVRVNNLQNVDLDIPHGQWVAVCGLSGSGKSSLAFDTLYAEGQRRYIDCLSPGTRQFITQLDKPDADLIDGIPPAIAVQAIRGTPDRKTTVGNASEIIEYLRLLFARVAGIVCPICAASVSKHDTQSAVMRLGELAESRKFLIAFRAAIDVSPLEEVLLAARRNGFLRAIIGGQTVNLDSTDVTGDELNSIAAGPVWIVVDRLTAGSCDPSRLSESIETAFQFGDGVCDLLVAHDETSDSTSDGETHLVDGRKFILMSFSTKLICHNCGRLFPPARPKLFSFNKGDDVCPKCDGLGLVDEDSQAVCSQCHGDRLGQNALAFKIESKNIADICRLSISDARLLFQQVEWSSMQLAISGLLLKQIESRLNYLNQVGLGYLSLDRPVRTLSGGEAQRVALTTCLSSTLVNMLYVLDEPSVGLHPHDIGNLTHAIEQLNQRGNTVVVVDHEEEMIRNAPRIVEIGPAAGVSGGEIVFDGSISELTETEGSVTGDFLAGRRGVSSGAGKRRPGRGKLRLTGARGHNLKNIDVEFPLGCLCVVSGVSGAGKSSLVQQTLFGAICRRMDIPDAAALPYDELFGDSLIDEVVLVDQSPIGRTARSNPVTYVKAFDDIRKTFAETADAKTHNFTASRFSFNVPGGRCDKCNGEGQLTIDMQFLSNVYIKCDQCNGTRFQSDTLAVRYRGRSIADVLNLTVREAFSFFRGQPKVQAKLKALIDVGLEYIRLGQPATTLSSGEAQRLKLAVYLNASKKKRALFILEEPTTGLHMADVTRLLDCFEALLSVGHSFIIVEHNLQLMKYADWIIDLGPGAADAGGQVVVSGTPETVAECSESRTGRYLAEALAKCVIDDA